VGLKKALHITIQAQTKNIVTRLLQLNAFSMNKLLFPALLIGLVACSRTEQQPVKPTGTQHSVDLRRYAVSFAAVKIPDEMLKQLALPPFEQIYSLEDQKKLAAYVVAHSEDFPITSTKGNCLPFVYGIGGGSHEKMTGMETQAQLLLDPKQEEKDFETLGLATRLFTVRVAVREVDSQDDVFCDWYCNYRVHLKEPVGNSTDHGGGIPCGPGVYPVGQPSISKLFHAKGVSLWLLGTLNTNTNR